MVCLQAGVLANGCAFAVEPVPEVSSEAGLSQLKTANSDSNIFTSMVMQQYSERRREGCRTIMRRGLLSNGPGSDFSRFPCQKGRSHKPSNMRMDSLMTVVVSADISNGHV